MTRSTPGQALFERAVTVHRFDCAAVASRAGPEGQGIPAAGGERPGPPGGRPSDEFAAYAVAARRGYDALRRLIGQASGLLILAEASGSRDVCDLPELAVARERMSEAAEAVAALRAPAGLSRHLARLRSAAADIDAALVALAAIGDAGEAAASAAAARLKTAYRSLQQASDERYGLAMVDFRQACCTCAVPVSS
jgi:hypothetical protein